MKEQANPQMERGGSSTRFPKAYLVFIVLCVVLFLGILVYLRFFHNGNTAVVPSSVNDLGISDQSSVVEKETFVNVADPETGEQTVFRPSESYTSTSKAGWSPNLKWLAYVYTVADADYAGSELLNVISYEEWKAGQYPNVKRVLVASSALDYQWLLDDSLLILQLQGFGQGERGSYAEASWNIYHPVLDGFEFPIKSGPYIPNVFTLRASSGDQKVIMLERVSASGGTLQEIRGVDGTIIEFSEKR